MCSISILSKRCFAFVELMDIPETSSSRPRRPTFIEASQAEWDEVRERLDSLYGLGMDILTKYPNLGLFVF